MLFGKPYDQAKYDRAVSAAALSHDISILPAGDGAILSGILPYRASSLCVRTDPST